VPVERQRAPVARPAPDRGDVRPVGVVAQRRGGAGAELADVPHLRGEADVGQFRGHELLRVAFAAERALRAHERAQQLELVLPSGLDGTAQVHGATVAHSGA
jgi:hypothetical protein